MVPGIQALGPGDLGLLLFVVVLKTMPTAESTDGLIVRVDTPRHSGHIAHVRKPRSLLQGIQRLALLD